MEHTSNRTPGTPGRETASADRATRPVFTTPPLCAASQDNIVAVDCRVAVSYLTGETVEGRLGGVPPAVDKLTVETPDGPHPLTARYEQLKMIRLPEPRRWRNLKSYEHTPLFANAVPQSFEIRFTDGDVLQGRTFGFTIDSTGLYLYPTDRRGTFYYVFIPHHAVGYRQIGPKIGEQLIADGAVAAGDVEAALDEQRDRRAKPLGEYLVENAVVTAGELEEALRRQRLTPEAKIGEILIRENLITPDQLERALRAQSEDRARPLGAILVERGSLSAGQLHQSLAGKLGIPFVDLDRFTPDAAALKKIPEDIARRHNVLALHRHQGRLVIALNDPLDGDAFDAVHSAAGEAVIVALAPLEKLRRAIDAAYAGAAATPADNDRREDPT